MTAKSSGDLFATGILQSCFEQALSQIAEAVVAIDAQGRVRYMNEAAEQLAECPAEQAKSRLLGAVLSIVDVLSGKDFADAIADAHLAAPESRAFRRALLLGGQGQPKIIDYRVTAVGTGASAPGTVIVVRDLMKQRGFEQALELSAASQLASTAALHEERERARVTLNSIGDAVVSTDFRGRVTFLNKIAENLIGWTLESAAGRALGEVFPLLDRQTRVRIQCPAMRAIIEDHTCRSAATEVLVRPDGTEIAVDHSASPIHDAAGGVIGVVMVINDATDARNHADTLTRLALYDALTGLPNRTLLADRLQHALHGVQRSSRVVSILFIDLDRFKAVNDTHGHAVGDRLLQQLAGRLLSCVRGTDTVARLGGDEFVVLLPDVHSAEDAVVCAGNIITALNPPFAIAGRAYRIGASIGIAATQPGSSSDGAVLLKQADIAMYHAKSAGRNRVSKFALDMTYDPEHEAS